MAERTYTDRELNSKFDNILDHMKDFEMSTTGYLERIEAQTVKTNGRVSTLERWQSYVVGFCVCIGFVLFSILIPFATSYIQSGKI